MKILLAIILFFFGIFLLIVGIKGFKTYHFTTKKEFLARHQELKAKAKIEYQKREAEKKSQPKKKSFLQSLSDPSSIPQPIRKTMGYPF